VLAARPLHVLLLLLQGLECEQQISRQRQTQTGKVMW
jgi:hypothetical protein